MGGPCQLISEKAGANAELSQNFEKLVVFVLLGPKYITYTGSKHDLRIAQKNPYMTPTPNWLIGAHQGA